MAITILYNYVYRQLERHTDYSTLQYRYTSAIAQLFIHTRSTINTHNKEHKSLQSHYTAMTNTADQDEDANRNSRTKSICTLHYATLHFTTFKKLDI